MVTRIFTVLVVSLFVLTPSAQAQTAEETVAFITNFIEAGVTSKRLSSGDKSCGTDSIIKKSDGKYFLDTRNENGDQCSIEIAVTKVDNCKFDVSKRQKILRRYPNGNSEQLHYWSVEHFDFEKMNTMKAYVADNYPRGKHTWIGLEGPSDAFCTEFPKFAENKSNTGERRCNGIYSSASPDFHLVTRVNNAITYFKQNFCKGKAF